MLYNEGQHKRNTAKGNKQSHFNHRYGGYRPDLKPHSDANDMIMFDIKCGTYMGVGMKNGGYYIKSILIYRFYQNKVLSRVLISSHHKVAPLIAVFQLLRPCMRSHMLPILCHSKGEPKKKTSIKE